MALSRNSAATIDAHYRTGSEGCCEKEHHRIRDIFRLTDPARWQELRRVREHRFTLVVFGEPRAMTSASAVRRSSSR
jgi:hypothetical protein